MITVVRTGPGGDRVARTARLPQIGVIRGNHWSVRFDEDTIGASRESDIFRHFLAHHVAGANGSDGKHGYNHISQFAALEYITPRPNAEGGGELGRIEEVPPLPRFKPVTTGADGREIGILRALQEIARQRHTVLHHQAVLRARASHAVRESVAKTDGAAQIAIEINPVQPVLLVTTNAIRREVGHAI